MYVLNVPHTSAVISSTVELFPPEQENETDAMRQDFMQMYLSAVLSLKSEKDKRVSIEIEKDGLQLALQKEKDLRRTLEVGTEAFPFSSDINLVSLGRESNR